MRSPKSYIATPTPTTSAVPSDEPVSPPDPELAGGSAVILPFRPGPGHNRPQRPDCVPRAPLGHNLITSPAASESVLALHAPAGRRSKAETVAGVPWARVRD